MGNIIGPDKREVHRSDVHQSSIKFGGYKNSSKPRPGYYKTPTSVYYRGKEITNCNSKSFAKLGNGWAKDKDNVFFQGKIINGADSKTFKIINKFGKDKNNKYHRGKIVY